MARLLCIPADTSLEAARVYFGVLRKKTGAERLKMVVDMSNSLRRRIEAGVRRRHPEYSDDEVRLAVLWLMVGDELFRQCRPDSTIAP